MNPPVLLVNLVVLGSVFGFGIWSDLGDGRDGSDLRMAGRWLTGRYREYQEAREAELARAREAALNRTVEPRIPTAPRPASVVPPRPAASHGNGTPAHPARPNGSGANHAGGTTPADGSSGGGASRTDNTGNGYEKMLSEGKELYRRAKGSSARQKNDLLDQAIAKYKQALAQAPQSQVRQINELIYMAKKDKVIVTN